MKRSLGGEGKGTLLKNTVMLYILQFSTYLLALLLAPYETRVLGVEVYGGLLEASASIVLYFQLVIDFGFLLSATEEVSRCRNDKAHLRKVLTSVTLAKLLLAVASFGVLMGLCQLIPAWKQKETLLILSFFASFLQSMLPDYMYHGMEKMSAITIRTVIIKVFFAAAIFLTLKKPEDVWLVPALSIAGHGIALIVAYVHLGRKLDIRFAKVCAADVFSRLKSSAAFFFSKIATTTYTALNTVILDIVTGSGAATGYYTSANKLITAGKNGLTPVADSLYPYMVRNKDFKLVTKVLLLAEPVIFAFCAVMFVLAEPFCVWFFGEEFAQTGAVLRAMLPVGVVIFPSYLLGFPMMTAMGISKHANYSTIFGSVVHVIMLTALFACGQINMMSLAVSVSVTETVILLYRIVVIVKNRHLLRPSAANESQTG